ncbi:hypothetical protein MAR_013475 [Mya arenaria]|uniref:Uncharacterized protein n=1 Tax=Mya arenaria TaxID=6604 RepID=A0ABY7G402_MYAAR|nr:hypothetical protein MAR_013475 [Mya arenaria]
MYLSGDPRPPFDCALQKASTQEFKFCIDIVTSNTGDDASEKEIKCERKKCVDTYIEGNKESPQCGLNASIQYRWSVIMAGGAIEVSDSVCGASGLFISAVLLFAALLVTRMF